MFDWFIYKLKKMLERKTTRGKINDLIDMIFHPFFGKSYGIAETLDFIFHSLNEQRVDLTKFAKYNLSSLIFPIIDVIKKMNKRKVSPRGIPVA